MFYKFDVVSHSIMLFDSLFFGFSLILFKFNLLSFMFQLCLVFNEDVRGRGLVSILKERKKGVFTFTFTLSVCFILVKLYV